MKVGLFLCVLLSLGVLSYGQQTEDNSETQGTVILSPGQITTPGQGGEIGRNFLNFFGYANALYDSNLAYQTQSSNGAAITNYGGYGGQAGGGFSLIHAIRHGSLGLSYNGSYSRYGSYQLGNGTNQFLNFSFTKALSRRLSINLSEGLTFTSNGGQSYNLLPEGGFVPSVQPFSQKIFYNSTSASLSYQATRRLHYFIGGNFFSSQYGPTNNVGFNGTGYNGLSGFAGAGYRFTQNTRLDGSYTFSKFSYSRGIASTTVNSVSTTLSHNFARHWMISASGGIGWVQTSGIASYILPVASDLFFVQGQFKQSAFSPIYVGTLTRNFRRSSFRISGGENVSGGNGLYLTSKNLFLNTSYSSQIGKRVSVTAAFGYSRLSSLANAAKAYGAINYNASGAYQLTRHAYVNATYDGWHYPQFAGYNRQFATRLSVGITFASRSYPLGLF